MIIRCLKSTLFHFTANKNNFFLAYDNVIILISYIATCRDIKTLSINIINYKTEA
jgi:hypothetical protein